MIGHSKPTTIKIDLPDEHQTQLPLDPESFVEQEATVELIDETIQGEVKPPKKKPSFWRSVLYASIAISSVVGVTALFLPFFVGCGISPTRSRNTEAKVYVGTMNRSQQSIWVENQTFGKSISALNADIKEETINHKYELESSDLATYQYAVSKNDRAKSFVGAVFVMPENSQAFQGLDQQVKPPQVSNQAGKKELTTFAILCESPEGIKTKLSKPFLNNGKPTCSEGTELIK